MAGMKEIGRRGRAGALVVLGTIALLTAGDLRARATSEPAGRIERIDLKTDEASTKVFVMLSRPLAFQVHELGAESAGTSARRLVLDFENAILAPTATTPVEVKDGIVQKIRTGQFTATTARIVLELAGDAHHAVDAYEAPPHVTVAVTSAPAVAPAKPPAADALGH